MVGVSLDDGEVLWLVFWSNRHEAGLSQLELVCVSLNDGKVLWLVLWSNWHELSLSKSERLLTIPVVSSGGDSKTGVWVNKWIGNSSSKKSG